MPPRLCGTDARLARFGSLVDFALSSFRGVVLARGPFAPLGHSKQIRHWSLMRMLYWLLRSVQGLQALPGSRSSRFSACRVKPENSLTPRALWQNARSWRPGRN